MEIWDVTQWDHVTPSKKKKTTCIHPETLLNSHFIHINVLAAKWLPALGTCLGSKALVAITNVSAPQDVWYPSPCPISLGPPSVGHHCLQSRYLVSLKDRDCAPPNHCHLSAFKIRGLRTSSPLGHSGSFLSLCAYVHVAFLSLFHFCVFLSFLLFSLLLTYRFILRQTWYDTKCYFGNFVHAWIWFVSRMWSVLEKLIGSWKGCFTVSVGWNVPNTLLSLFTI